MTRHAGRAYALWRRSGWRGLVTPEERDAVDRLVALADATGGRRSRHARTVRVIDQDRPQDRPLWVKTYPSPGARFARRAFRMHGALASAGFATPELVLVGSRGGEGLLITRDAGGEPLLDAVRARSRSAKRRLLERLGAEVAALHGAGFVAGDLVPSNLIVRGDALVFLDHDRTRRSRLLVWWHGRRNLVQLGRFVVPGLTLTDRARVLGAYATGRGWSTPRRRRLARWLVEKITARRARIDGIEDETVKAVGFRELMRSGGDCDPLHRGRR